MLYISLFFIAVLAADCFLVYRKACAIHSVCRLSAEEKIQLLSKLLEPAGFSYEPKQDIFISQTDGQTVLFCLDALAEQPPQWKNRLLCGIYRWITRPFQKNIDRLLYFYAYLPFAFYRILALSITLWYDT